MVSAGFLDMVALRSLQSVRELAAWGGAGRWAYWVIFGMDGQEWYLDGQDGVGRGCVSIVCAFCWEIPALRLDLTADS